MSKKSELNSLWQNASKEQRDFVKTATRETRGSIRQQEIAMLKKMGVLANPQQTPTAGDALAAVQGTVTANKGESAASPYQTWQQLKTPVEGESQAQSIARQRIAAQYYNSMSYAIDADPAAWGPKKG